MRRNYDNKGRQTLGVTDPVAKFFGVASVGWSFTGAAQSGTIVDGRFTSYPMHEGFAIPIDAATDLQGNGPRLRIDGNTLTWSYRNASASAATRLNATFIYGVR